MDPTRDDRFTATARWAGADEATISAARQCLLPGLVVSGRLASGKDTVAEAVMRELGHPDAVRVSFATPLRKEMDEILDAVRAAGIDRAVETVAAVGGVAADTARRTAGYIVDALTADPYATSWTRTTAMRRILQEWGTDVRRAQDGDYWVKQAMRHVVELLAAQRAVYITDARFPNEVSAGRDLGLYAVRLTVDLPTRAARLLARDGLAIDPAAENHPSEQLLETYPAFDVWVDNSGPLTDTVADVIDALLPVPATR